MGYVGPLKLTTRLAVERLEDSDVDWLNSHLSLAGATNIVYGNHLCIPPLPSGKGGCKHEDHRTRRPY